MNLARRTFLHLAAGAAALPAVSRGARAQAYPTRPITIIVPFAVGGATDVIARLLAERIRQSLGQPVIVENVTGAGGTIAVGRVARAAPDGYTLILGNNGSHVVTGATYAVHYDLLNDFEPIALLSTGPSVLVARKTMPSDDLKGLIAWLKSNPDKATWGGTLIAPLRAFRTWWLVRSTCARGTPRPPKGGDREVVADHQGGWDQGGSEPRRPVWVIT